MLLAIDTSAGTSVAVMADDGTLLAARSTPDTRRHAEVIGPFLAECFAVSGVAPDELTAVVAGVGPGPFTGLRVGLAAARVMALARDIPLLPVVSHDAVALQRVVAGEVAGRFAVVTDARRREVAVTGYAAGLPVPSVVEPTHLVPRIDYVPAEGWTSIEVTEIDAEWLARAALARRGADLPFVSPEALYLRAPDVTPSAGPKRVTG